MENNKRAKALKLIKWMLLLGCTLFVISIFLPFYTIYDLYSYQNLDRVVYGYESGFIYFFSLYFVLSVLGFLTFSKTVVHILNPLLLLAIFITLWLKSYSIGKFGGDFYTSLESGFYIQAIVIGAMVICSYSMSFSFNELNQPKWLFRTLVIAILGISVSVITGILIFLYKDATKPPKNTGMFADINRDLKNDQWKTGTAEFPGDK